MSSGKESKKSKTQKRNQQRKKNRGDGSVNTKLSNQVGALQSALAASQQKQKETDNVVQALKTVITKQPGSASNPELTATADFKQAISMLDEKFVKVPSAAEIEAKKMSEILQGVDAKMLNAYGGSLLMDAIKQSRKVAEAVAVTEKTDDDLIAKFSTHLKELLRNSHRPGRRRGNGKAFYDETAITLWISGSATSAATTAQAPVINIQPGSATEYSSLANLFDMYICDGFELHFRVEATTGTTGVDFGSAFDPEDASAYGALETLLAARVKHAPLCQSPGTHSSPLTTNATGFHTMKTTYPKAPANNQVTGSGNAIGIWQATASNTCKFGYIKNYVNAASAGTTVFYYYLAMHCRFRSRT